MIFSFEDKKLILNNKTVEMEVAIQDVDQFGGLLIVTLDYELYPERDPHAEQNIVALDSVGEIKWRIQRTPSAPTLKGEREFNPYVGIDVRPVRDDGLLEAYDGSGLCWSVDPETGNVSNPIVTK